MSRQFTHLLLTRFNTAVDFAPSPKRLDPNWLTARLALFEQYCFPSVAGQESADFQWLVFFDSASPVWFKERISTFEPLVKPIYIDGPATDEVIARRVVETGLVTSPYLISTRLDNDDAISKDHLASVQNAFHQQDREFLMFPLGLQSFHGHLYNVYWPSNPFLSLIEKPSKNGQVTTVFCVAHDRVREHNNCRTVLRSHQWLQVLHDSNLANALRGWPRVNSRFHPSFRVAWPKQPIVDSIATRLRYAGQGYIARAGKLIAGTAVRYKRTNKAAV
jgi:Putative rhamnosyl transferase